MSREMVGKWIWNVGDEENWNCCDIGFDTREEAIEEGNKAAYENDYIKYQVGQVECFKPYINAEGIIEQIQDNANDEHGEYAEGYLDYLKREDVNELEEKLNEVLNEWLGKTNNYPTFYKIVNVSDHEIRES